MTTSPITIITTETIASKKLENLFDKSQKNLTDKEKFHALRGQIFQEIGRIYEKMNHRELKFFENDKCLSHAESIVRKKSFSNHPESLNRLHPLAEKYLAAFDVFQQTIHHSHQPLEKALDDLDDLVSSHEAFAPAYLSELKQVYANRSKIFNIYRPDIAVFVESFCSFLTTIERTSYFDLCDKIHRDAPEILRLLPKIAICHALHSESLPKIFHKYKEEFSELKIQFLKLSREEREQIEEALKLGRESDLSLHGQSVMSGIEEIAENAFQGDQAKLGARLLEKSVQELKRSLASEATPKNLKADVRLMPPRMEFELRSFI